ncbi:MAG: VCBS repeat-containing protein [Armatimonadota bacterium]|nr:VCBS repeat-containing protein [Armatimonadota bacterium]
MPELRFEHTLIDSDPPGSHHDITLLHDLTGNGLPDVIIGGKEGPPNLFWYENPGWARHEAADAPNLEAGGVVVDVNGDGRPDVIAGQQGRDGHLLWWFECPADPREPWPVRVLTDRFAKYHDQAVGDVDGDGEPEVVFLSQVAGVLAHYDIPEDPTIEPWPEERLTIIADDMENIEGLVIVDLDGDGRSEIIAGTHIFSRGDHAWSRRTYAEDFVTTRVAVGDLDADGALEIVLCEGESNEGRLALCDAPDFEPELLREGLFHPHSLALADFDGDGALDIFVGEIGLGRNPHQPELLILRNLRDGGFEEQVISRGIPTHEAKVADIDGDGRPDIVGKPYMPQRHIDLWLNRS